MFPHASDWENAPAVSASADSAAACRLTAGFTRSAARTAPPSRQAPIHSTSQSLRSGRAANWNRDHHWAVSVIARTDTPPTSPKNRAGTASTGRNPANPQSSPPARAKGTAGATIRLTSGDTRDIWPNRQQSTGAVNSWAQRVADSIERSA